MKAQRDHLVGALAQIVGQVDRVDDLTLFLQGLGRDHRKFGALAEHYDVVGDSLLATLAHFAGDTWTPELASDWRDAFSPVASGMITAGQEDQGAQPPLWPGPGVSLRRQAIVLSVVLGPPGAPAELPA